MEALVRCGHGDDYPCLYFTQTRCCGHEDEMELSACNPVPVLSPYVNPY